MSAMLCKSEISKVAGQARTTYPKPASHLFLSGLLLTIRLACFTSVICSDD